MGSVISGEIQGLFENDTFDPNQWPLPADEILSVKLALKTKLNSNSDLDKLKARVCLRGDIQIKDNFKSWSPTASTRLLKCLETDMLLEDSTMWDMVLLWMNINFIG